MNLEGSWKYVSKVDIASFGGIDKRKLEFSRKGKIGYQIRSFPLAFRHNRVVFVHGGISSRFSRMAKLNYTKLYNTSDPFEALNIRAAELIAKGDWSNRLFSYELSAGEQGPYDFGAGPLWFRGYASEEFMKYEVTTCLDLMRSLAILEADIMVIGHVCLNILLSFVY